MRDLSRRFSLQSTIAVLVAHRQAIERVAIRSPMRREPIRTGHEVVAVAWPRQVKQLLHNHVFKILRWLFRQFSIQSNRSIHGLQLPHFVFIRYTQ